MTATYEQTIEDLDLYLERKGITHFSAVECLTLRRLGVQAPVPPVSMWENILPALELAEKIRAAVGHPLVIGNGYRPTELNNRVGGARKTPWSPGSQHLYFRALDIDLPGNHRSRAEQEALYESAACIYLTYGKSMKMGLGIYRPHRGPRVHIDCGWRMRCWGGPSKRWVNDLLAEVR